jgi:hypothetical protein
MRKTEICRAATSVGETSKSNIYSVLYANGLVWCLLDCSYHTMYANQETASVFTSLFIILLLESSLLGLATRTYRTVALLQYVLILLYYRSLNVTRNKAAISRRNS